MSAMFEQGLDAIDQSNNTVVSYMNHRVDEISDSVSAAMHNENLMEFAGMAMGLPLLGLGLVCTNRYLCRPRGNVKKPQISCAIGSD